MSKTDAAINQHDARPAWDWQINVLSQPVSGPESGESGDNKHRRFSLDEMRALLVEAKNIANNLEEIAPGKVLDARQGKVLDDAIQLRELLGNKVTEFSTNPSDETYPTEKLVKDALDVLTSRVDKIGRAHV